MLNIMFNINDMVSGQSHYSVYPSAPRSELAERAEHSHIISYPRDWLEITLLQSMTVSEVQIP